MLTKKKRKILKKLGTLLAIANDYIYDKGDIKTTAEIAGDIAWLIDKRKGSDLMIEAASNAYSKFRAAEKSSSNVGGKQDEETKTDK